MDGNALNFGYSSPSFEKASSFTTGPRSGGYMLESVTAPFAVPGGSPGNIVVAVHTESGGNPVDNYQVTLTGPNPTAADTYTYNCSGSDCALAANTTYFVVMSAPGATGNGFYAWQGTSSDDQTLTPSGNGWSLADGAKNRGGGNWADVVGQAGKFRIVADTVNTGSVGLTARVANSAVVLTLSNGPASWWFKIDTAGSCTAANGGSTHPHTGGIGGYTGPHTVQAYSDSQCNTQIASTSFTV